MTETNPRISAEVRAEAIEWLIAFSEGDADARARARFNEWLRRSPEHVATYLRVSAFWQDADRIEPKHRRDIDKLVAEARAESNVYPLGRGLPAAPVGRWRRRVSLRAVVAAAVVLIVVGIATLWLTGARMPTYATEVGELRTITLDDGSVVTLDAASRMSVSFTRTQRLIELSEGQALFRVAKDPARPFVVNSNNTRVTVLGTQFDVNRKSNGTVVTVLEGRVSVAGPPREPLAHTLDSGPMLVSAGEQAIVTPAQASKHRSLNPANATAWTTGLLVFDSEPLREVARAFNRQNTKHLVVADPELQELRISGVFPATAAGRIAAFLQQRFAVQVIETDTEIRIEKPQG
jgi:transmembrane sensor